MEMQIYCGKCKCGIDLVMRIVEVRADEKNPKSKIESWIIHGFCKKCEHVYVQGLFFQEEKPVINRDFMIDGNKKIQESEKGGK